MITAQNWTFSSDEALILQQELASQVEHTTRLGPVRYVAGLDVHVYDGMARAAVVVLDFNTLKLVDVGTAICPVAVAYKPGLLAFREGPVLFDAIKRLDIMPDLLIFDGQGIAHPHHLGIASHLGVMLDLPSIGCAKSKLFGHYDELGETKGSYTPLLHEEEVIGAVVRSHDKMKPLYVSIGHRVDLETSVKYVLACCRDHRLPETTRWADKLARRGDKMATKIRV